jgi:hypothetical protein
MNDLPKISLFLNKTLTTPVAHIPLWDFCANVINGAYRSEIEDIRNEQDPDKRKTLKCELPAVTVSGMFSERNKNGLIKLSGYLCIDMDSKDNPGICDWKIFRDSIGTWDEVVFCALSASGKGAFAIIHLAYPECHLAQFKALQQDFKGQGVIIDKNCSDVTRLRFMSYDPGAKFNYSATPYNRNYTEQTKKNYSPFQRYPGSADMNKLLNKILASGVDITFDYEDWFSIGCVLASDYGESGRSLFHELSSMSLKYNHDKCDIQFNSCLQHKSGRTNASIFWIAKKYGITINSN